MDRAARRRRVDQKFRRLGPQAAAVSPQPRPIGIALRVVWWTAVAILVLYTGLALERKITWYLAVDQFGYLTFAHDLLAGHVFHQWPPMTAFAKQIDRTDVLAQTYVYDHGRLFCRYAPGFPMILAAWIGIFGDDGAAYLNVTLYLLLVALLIAFQRRVFRSRWRALAGACLFILFPTMAHLWALTLTRDLSGHLTAFVALFLLLPWRARPLDARRAAMAGLGLGFAAAIRPDGVLYLIPATSLALVHWRREKASLRRVAVACASAATAMAIGLSPALAYNWASTGNPFRPTQGMEVEQFFSRAPQPTPVVVARADDDGDRRVGYPSPGWHGGTVSAVQGGALRLAHLSTTLPANLSTLREAYGWLFLGLAGWGAVLAFVQRRVLFAVAVPYVLLAVLFYSCWSRPDPRYLMGVHILLPMLVVEGTLGTLDLVRRLALLDRAENARLLAGIAAVAVIVAAFVVPEVGRNTALPAVTGVMAILTTVGAGLAALWPKRRIVRFVAPVMALALVALSVSRSNASLGARATFQRPQVVNARATLGRALEPNAVVITTEDIGRPAENIEYYSGGAHAVYLTDIYRWHLIVPFAVSYLQENGFTPYLLGPPDMAVWSDMIKRVAPYLDLQLIADIPAPRAIEYFVAAPFHRGIHLTLYKATWRKPKAR